MAKLKSEDEGKGSHQKKNYQILDIVQTWGGVSGAPKLFIKKKGMDMF